MSDLQKKISSAPTNDSSLLFEATAHLGEKRSEFFLSQLNCFGRNLHNYILDD